VLYQEVDGGLGGPPRPFSRVGRIAAVLAMTIARVALADDAPQGSPPGTAPGSSDLSLAAYLDTAYSHLSGDGRFTSGTADRVFDTKSDSATLQQAAVSFGYQPKAGVGAFVNVIAGDDASVIRPYNYSGSSAHFDVTQAYLQWASAAVTVIAGRFVTLAGAEAITSTANTNFSRSILFGFAIPFTHTGARATVTAGDTVCLYLGINNGWDDVDDTTSSRTVELGAGYTPSRAVNVTVSGYFGNQRVGGLVGAGPEGQRALLDVVATWNVTETVSVVANMDAGRQSNVMPTTGGMRTDARWDGVALYFNWMISDRWRSSLRAEYFDDAAGYRTGVPQVWRELTATVAYLSGKHLEFRGERRVDVSSASSFQASDGTADGQGSVAFEVLYKY